MRHSRISTATAALFAITALACGDDNGSGPNVPDLTRADVAGIYEMTDLSFDPRGSLPEADVLERLDPATVPELVVAANRDSLQLVFRRPGELVRTVPGSYRLGDTSIEVRFSNSTEPALILLPQTFDLAFDEVDETLAFNQETQVDTTRLFELVEEWSGEPVTNPLPGNLRVVFDRSADD